MHTGLSSFKTSVAHLPFRFHVPDGINVNQRRPTTGFWSAEGKTGVLIPPLFRRDLRESGTVECKRCEH
jgi:hypothetical protein